MTEPYEDPFASQSRPSLSFDNAPVNTVHGGVVAKRPEKVQSRDYNTGDPAFWPDGNKKMSVVVAVTTDDGEDRSIWAPIPSAMYKAFGDAIAKLGRPIDVGDDIRVKFTGEKPNPDRKKHAQKLYAVKITAGVPAPEPDPFDAADSSGDDEPPF